MGPGGRRILSGPERVTARERVPARYEDEQSEQSENTAMHLLPSPSDGP